MSYGSFTCTVEGFDEPFRVMRMVVDYFQSLTAADPSFGAQPRRLDPEEVTRRAHGMPGVGPVSVALDPIAGGDGIIVRSALAEDAQTATGAEARQNGFAAAPEAVEPASATVPARADIVAPKADAAPVVAEAAPVVAEAEAPVVAEAKAPTATEPAPIMAQEPHRAADTPAAAQSSALSDADALGSEPQTADAEPVAEADTPDVEVTPVAPTILEAEAVSDPDTTPDMSDADTTADMSDPAPAAPQDAKPEIITSHDAPAETSDLSEEFNLPNDETFSEDDYDQEIAWDNAFEALPGEDERVKQARMAAARSAEQREEEALRRVLRAIEKRAEDAAIATEAGAHRPAAEAASDEPVEAVAAAPSQSESDAPAIAASAESAVEATAEAAPEAAKAVSTVETAASAEIAEAEHAAVDADVATARVEAEAEPAPQPVVAKTPSRKAAPADPVADQPAAQGTAEDEAEAEDARPAARLANLSTGLAPHRKVTMRKRPPLQGQPDLAPLDAASTIGEPWKDIAASAPPAEPAPADTQRTRVPLAERLFGRKSADATAKAPEAQKKTAAAAPGAKDEAAKPTPQHAATAQQDADDTDEFVFDEEAFLARTRAKVEEREANAAAAKAEAEAKATAQTAEKAAKAAPLTQPANEATAATPKAPSETAKTAAPAREEMPMPPQNADAVATEAKPVPALRRDAVQPAQPAAVAPAAASLQVVGREAEAAAASLTGGSDLATFTRRFGAASLPELLEASAAYTTLVRGQTRFSRRDIMLALEEIGGEDEYTQEARIKSFGKLLRKGSIVRVDDGKFALSRTARFSYEEKLSATG
ncbi:MAG: hypothetical protein AAGE13_02010 [Pseudomonadota bacterium]